MKSWSGTAGKRDDPFGVFIRPGGVGDVGEPLPGSDAERALLQPAERHRPVRRSDARIVGLAAPHRPLRGVQPGADGKPKRGKPLLPHVHAHSLLQREGDAGRAVIEHRRLDPEILFFEEDALRQFWRPDVHPPESLARMKKRGHPHDPAGPELRGLDGEIGEVSPSRFQV